MKDAAARFVGTHDFTSFAAFDGFGRRRQRTQYAARDFVDGNFGATEDGGGTLVHNVHGRSFLRYMVRKMVGALLEVGRGKLVSSG